MYTCKPLSSAETYLVRHPVLRPGKPFDTCLFVGDDWPSTKHFGIFHHDTVIGVLSLFVQTNPLFSHENQLQFRGMAVLSEYQNKGIGAQLMAYAETQLTTPRPVLIWLNARLKAITFYEKMGYHKIGEPFTIGDIGIHYVMCKMS